MFVNFSPPPLRTTWVQPVAAGFSLLSFVTTGLSLVPYGSTLRSDGARIWMLCTSVRGTRRWIAAAALASQQRRGIRPRAWKQTWLKVVCSVRDASVDEYSGNMLAYMAASDRKDAAQSATFLERCLELMPSAQLISRELVAREASYFCAWFRGDAIEAERWLSQVKRLRVATPLVQIRTNIALSCARRDFDAAFAGWMKGAEFIERLPRTSIKSLLQESWREWGDEIRQRQGQKTRPNDHGLGFQA